MPHRSAAESPTVDICVFGPLKIAGPDGPLKLSARAAILLTYLTLEGRPIHRTTAAQLLWPGTNTQALASLRVELSGLRRHGIDLGPARSPQLAFKARTELHLLQTLHATDQADFIRHLRRPLEDFNDLNHPTLTTWLKRQRALLRERIRAVPASAQAKARPDAAEWPLPYLHGQLRAQLRPTPARAQLSPVLTRPGDGVTEALPIALTDLGWRILELNAALPPDQFMATLRVNTGHFTAAGNAAHLTPETELAVRLLTAGPTALIISNAHRLQDGHHALLTVMLSLAGPLAVLPVTTESASPQLLRRLADIGHPFTTLQVPPTPPHVLRGANWPCDPFNATRQTEGRVQLLSTLSAEPVRQRLDESWQKAMTDEVTAAFGRHASHLALLAAHGESWSTFTARHLLRREGLTHADTDHLLREAIAAGVLHRVDQVVTVKLPNVDFRVRDDAPLLHFTSELQRAALAATLDPATRQALRLPASALPTRLCADGDALCSRPAGPLPLWSPTQSYRLPGGYTLLKRPTGFTVLRMGLALTPAPRLQLDLGAAPSRGVLRMALPLQTLHPQDTGVRILPSAQTSTRTLHVRPWPTDRSPGPDPAEITIPSHEPLVLSVQASHLILHVEDAR